MFIFSNLADFYDLVGCVKRDFSVKSFENLKTFLPCSLLSKFADLSNNRLSNQMSFEIMNLKQLIYLRVVLLTE